MDQRTLVIALCAYLAGSIPFSQIIATWRAGLRLLEVGEGNVGSRNVWHVVGPPWGVTAGLLDCLKGYLVCLAASVVATPGDALLAGVAVMLGHQFPIFLRGRGGKGLATGLGVMLSLSPVSTVCGLAALGVAYVILHNFNPSLAVAMVAIIVLPIAFRQPLWVSGYALGLSLLAAFKKWLDRSHETRVWSERPWKGTAAPGWQRPTALVSEDIPPPGGGADGPEHP
jgi:acyl phosphate:glycerol-3-phosphate acyltransferase